MDSTHPYWGGEYVTRRIVHPARAAESARATECARAAETQKAPFNCGGRIQKVADSSRKAVVAQRQAQADSLDQDREQWFEIIYDTERQRADVAESQVKQLQAQVDSLRQDREKWLDMYDTEKRATHGFSIDVCAMSGVCVQVRNLLPSDTIETLFYRVQATELLKVQSTASLGLVVGEVEYGKDLPGYYSTLEEAGLANGTSVFAVACANDQKFDAGTEVEYWSGTHHQWMRARVEGVKPWRVSMVQGLGELTRSARGQLGSLKACL